VAAKVLFKPSILLVAHKYKNDEHSPLSNTYIKQIKIADAGDYGKWAQRCMKTFVFSHNYIDHPV
jgi:hypothetical protein